MRSRATAWALLWLAVASGFVLPQVQAEGQDGWHEAQGETATRWFRVTLEVPVPEGMEGVRDLPVQRVLNLAETLASAGYPSRSLTSGASLLQGFELDLDSFTLWELTAQGPRRLPVLVSPGGPEFDPSSHPVVLVSWVMDGEAAAKRTFQLYFNSVYNPSSEAVGAVDSALQSTLAASVGPGRGNRLFVPLHDLPGAQGSLSEQRKVWITNLFPGSNEVKLYEYRFGMPDLREPVAVKTLVGAGAVYAYTLGNFGVRSSEGGVYIEADRPVVAEARSAADGFKANLFIPSVDGGYIGRAFRAANLGPSESWAVHCPVALAVALSPGKGCKMALNGGALQTVGAGETLTLTVPGNAAVGSLLEVTAGQVMVQRIGSGMAAWPAIDGPSFASSFMGWAGAQDALLVSSPDGSCIMVQSLAGSRPPLTDSKQNKLCLGAGTLADSMYAWGSGWDRDWERVGSAHSAGAASLQGYGLQDGPSMPHGPLTVASGPLADSVTFSSLVVPQSSDGGFEYLVHVPSARSNPGVALGKIVIYGIFAGTAGEAVRVEDGDRIPLGPLRALERLDLGSQELQGAGTWRISMDQPVLVAWLKRGTGDFAGPVPAFTSGGQIDVAGAAYVGPALGVAAAEPIVQKHPGDSVSFRVAVENRGRTLSGQALRDRVTLEVIGEPAGWPQATVVPSTLDMAGGQAEPANVTVSIDIPADANVSAGGVSLTVIARSGNNPSLAVDEALRINYLVKRVVDVKVDSQDVEARQELPLGGTARYLITVTNKGSAPDSYGLAISPPGSAWDYTLPPGLGYTWSTGTLAPGQSETVPLQVWPLQQGAAPAQITNVRAISASDRSVFDTVRIVTAVGVERSFRAEADEPDQAVGPGQSAQFLVRIHNEADVNEELYVEVLPDLPGADWSTAGVWWVRGPGEEVPLDAVNHVIPIEPQSVATLRVLRPVPATAPPLSLAQDTLRLRSTAVAESAGTDLHLRTVVARIAGFQATLVADGEVVRPGSTIELNLTLSSTGNDVQELRISPVLPAQGSPWVLSADGSLPPWNLTLPAHGKASLGLALQVPADAPPRAQAPSLLALSVATRGANASVVPLLLNVQEHRALEAATRMLNVSAGWTHVVEAQVRNLGNVAVLVQPILDGLAPGWDAQAEEALIGVGATVHLPIRLTVPLEAAAATLASLQVLDVATGRSLATAPWTLRIGHPSLQAEAMPAVDLLQGRAYRIRVSNTGDAPAYNVTLELIQSGKVVDRFQVAQILPGASHVAALVGPAGTGLEVEVTAAHDPQGRLIAAVLPTQDVAGRSQGLPSLPLPVLALALAALAMRRGRWR